MKRNKIQQIMNETVIPNQRIFLPELSQVASVLSLSVPLLKDSLEQSVLSYGGITL